jgi:CRISPR-associated exonuclease Cas4
MPYVTGDQTTPNEGQETGEGPSLATMTENPMDMAEDAETVPVSAVEHYSYCPRQCALIHVEQVFDENLYTIRGRIAHERVDEGDDSVMDGVVILRSLPIWSEQLGLRGKCDLVEMQPDGPYPVEYKVGRRHGRHPDLQLCAQALCLEEMLGVAVTKGAIFYRALRRRHEVEINDELRRVTVAAIEAVREIMREQRLPDAVNDGRCPNCSLVDTCLPAVMSEHYRLRGLQGSLFVPYDLAQEGSSDA